MNAAYFEMRPRISIRVRGSCSFFFESRKSARNAMSPRATEPAQLIHLFIHSFTRTHRCWARTCLSTICFYLMIFPLHSRCVGRFFLLDPRWIFAAVERQRSGRDDQTGRSQSQPRWRRLPAGRESQSHRPNALLRTLFWSLFSHLLLTNISNLVFQFLVLLWILLWVGGRFFFFRKLLFYETVVWLRKTLAHDFPRLWNGRGLLNKVLISKWKQIFITRYAVVNRSPWAIAGWRSSRCSFWTERYTILDLKL